MQQNTEIISEYLNYNETSKKPEYNIAKAYDNDVLYKIYKKIPVKDIVILISNTDRTTSIKERYEESITISEYIKQNKNEFLELIQKSSDKEIENLDKMQKDFEKNIPYFIRYDKNYLWQIYYSKIDDKYFMLFPAKEGETSVLFYLMNKKLKENDSYIYVPICKEEYSEEILTKKQISDLENYIWLFTNEFPITYEVTSKEGITEIYLTGKTRVQENLETKYRIELKNKNEAEKQYALMKALFILTTETNYNYKFEPRIDENGKLILNYNDEEITFEKLEEFIKNENIKQRDLETRLNKKIKDEKAKLEELKLKIKEQTELYSKQEKQIVLFLDCKKSFFKRIKFFFSSNKKMKLNFKESQKTDDANKKVHEDEKTINETASNENLKINKSYTIADLVKICAEAKKIIEEEKNLTVDIKALELKKENMSRKIENAQEYIEEIENHKKSIFEFWKFTNKDKLPELEQGGIQENESKIQVEFNFEEDLPELMIKADELQRRKLSIDECNAIFLCRQILPAINSSICKCDTYIIGEEYEKIIKEYSPKNKLSEIFGGILDDYTKIKQLNNRKHRENPKNIYAILNMNDSTSVDDFKNIIKEKSKLINEAYQKITSINKMPIYYVNKQKGYTIGDINPYNLFKNSQSNKIYKMNLEKSTHILYMSNIIFYDNYNKTLPLGMDESTEVIVKVGENKKISEKNINLLVERDLFNVEIRKVKMIEEKA